MDITFIGSLPAEWMGRDLLVVAPHPSDPVRSEPDNSMLLRLRIPETHEGIIVMLRSRSELQEDLRRKNLMRLFGARGWIVDLDHPGALQYVELSGHFNLEAPEGSICGTVSVRPAHFMSAS